MISPHPHPHPHPHRPARPESWPRSIHNSPGCSVYILYEATYLIVLYTNKLYSKILHPVTDEDTMLQTSNTRSYTLSRSSNTRSYIILRASNTQSYITLRASNTQGYIILRISNTRSYTCHGRRFRVLNHPQFSEP
jgi:hypothetical protein